jgi:cellulose synthase/poly-beta-1,6-N-acetylglucosamine synthase-like glycosyltransferase
MILSWLPAAILAVPSSVFASEVVLGALSRPGPRLAAGSRRPRIAVLMPAHNEQAGILNTLRTIAPQLGSGDRLLVVADNCTDDTATVAREFGASVVERSDSERRGKGYALAYGVEVLAKDPPEVVIVMDADCEPEAGCVEQIAQLCIELGRPVQADYTMRAPEAAKLGARVSTFAFRVRNRLRPLGLAALGMPCHLTGTGMAFPWATLRDAPALHGHITEDLMLGLELALIGKAPAFCASARVVSELAQSDSGQQGQRERWEHGHLALIRSHLFRLLGEAVSQRNLGLLASALDLAVPPLSLLCVAVTASGAISAVVLVAGGGAGPLVLATAEAVAVGAAVVVAWRREGTDLLSLTELGQVPRYVLNKVPSYVRALSGRAERKWRRAERRAD